jgi:hypothetical protein
MRAHKLDPQALIILERFRTGPGKTAIDILGAARDIARLAGSGCFISS